MVPFKLVENAKLSKTCWFPLPVSQKFQKLKLPPKTPKTQKFKTFKISCKEALNEKNSENKV